MKKFFKDFKAFISRGNIIDMAVGVIIGGAFSTIVKALTDKIIMPVINWLLALGGSGLDSAYTFLKKVYEIDPTTGTATNIVDLSKSIYIDWGAFITAIIDFLLIAFVLFIILKAVMKSSALLREASDKAKQGKLTKEQKKELKSLGINKKDKEAVALYLEGKKQEEEKAKAEAEAQAKIEEEEKMKNSTEYILKEIRDLLKENKELREAQLSQNKETKE